jgi:hypothetical protein
VSRYIEIDKAIPIAIQAVVDVVGHGISQVDAVLIAERFEEAPTADVVEVRHGEWVFGKLGGRDAWVCSLCGAGFTGENAEWIAKEHDFCAKCGAKMDGERKEK